MKNNPLCSGLLFSCLLLVFISSAQAFVSPVTLSDELYIDNRILSLVNIGEKNPKQLAIKIKPLLSALDSFNAAEQRVLLQLSSLIVFNSHRYTQALDIMKKAYDLESKIPKKQLNYPLFSNAHMLMADIYEALGEFDSAFLEKKAFLVKYYDYNDHVKSETIAKLNKKYETEKKKRSNELLRSKNKVKELQLLEVSAKNESQKNNIILILLTLVVFIALIVRQLQISKKLVLISRTDGLTKLSNRQALFEQSQKLFSKMGNSNVTVIMIDVDYFKKINDDYGHVVGDKVLKQIAKLGCEVMRSRDIFARIGGEEFVAVLPEVALEEAKAIAERFREKVANHDFSNVGIKRMITLSLGLASIQQIRPLASTSPLEFDELLQAADNAMYQAKDQGRNRIAIYSEH